MSPGFSPPAYPYDRLDPLKQEAAALDGGLVDLSIGTPCDPPPAAVVDALATSGAERGYPPSAGSSRFREAAAGWLARRFGVDVDPAIIGACVGSKELVASTPHYLRLRNPDRDTVLYPAVSYPTYEMGATLAGCRAVPVAVDDRWRIDVGTISDEDARRAVCLWVNTPGNPAGNVDDLAAVAQWGAERGVLVLSDECYAEFTWDGPAQSILQHGIDGVVAMHSLSKRSNLAGIRAGFYAGDPEIVQYLTEVRKHAGLMMPGPVQDAAAVALDDDGHVTEQRTRYLERLDAFRSGLAELGLDVPLPGGGFYLWLQAPDGNAWACAEWFARKGGALVSPGEFYGPAGTSHVRIAMVQPIERLMLVLDRLHQ